MKGIYLLFILSFVLLGCSGIYERVENRLDDGTVLVSAVNDAKLSHSKDLYCNGQSTGAVAREYGPDAEIWDLYWTLCNAFRSGGDDINVPPSAGQLREK